MLWLCAYEVRMYRWRWTRWRSVAGSVAALRRCPRGRPDRLPQWYINYIPTPTRNRGRTIFLQFSRARASRAQTNTSGALQRVVEGSSNSYTSMSVECALCDGVLGGKFYFSIEPEVSLSPKGSNGGLVKPGLKPIISFLRSSSAVALLYLSTQLAPPSSLEER